MPAESETINVKIGLEVHVPLNTGQKLYCPCPTNYYEIDSPNINTCPVCTGMPGSKPYPLNNRALESAVMVSQMLDCKIVEKNIYVKRKHYDYPDLPSGYQRTSEPIGVEGKLNKVGIWEVHLEEDPGRYDLATGRVDYNRSGVPLIEIVTAPDMRSAEDARDFLRELLNLLKYSERIIEAGGVLRADVNISIEGGARVEIKNVNSVVGAFKAVQFEIIRQKGLMKRGGVVKQETRGFNEKSQITIALRVKETAADYRYIPDPDIPPLLIEKEYVDSIVLPETPQSRRKRLMEDYSVREDYAQTMVRDKDVADLFEETVRVLYKMIFPDSGLKVFSIDSETGELKYLKGTWLINDLSAWTCREVLKQLNYRNIELKESKITPQNLAEILYLVHRKEMAEEIGKKLVASGEISEAEFKRRVASNEITESVGKKLLERIIDSGENPKEIVETEKLGRVSGKDTLSDVVDEVLKENPQTIQDYKSGKNEALNYLMGQVMKKMRGRADHGVVNRLLKERL